MELELLSVLARGLSIDAEHSSKVLQEIFASSFREMSHEACVKTLKEKLFEGHEVLELPYDDLLPYSNDERIMVRAIVQWRLREGR